MLEIIVTKILNDRKGNLQKHITYLAETLKKRATDVFFVETIISRKHDALTSSMTSLDCLKQCNNTRRAILQFNAANGDSLRLACYRGS